MTAAADIAPAWFTSRAAGITALLLCSLSVALGLARATGSMPARVRGVTFRSLHEALGLAALATIAVHGLALLADPFLKPGLAGVLVPFASPYRPLAVAAGQIAGYGLAALALAFYARRTVGVRRWRAAHTAIPAFWMLAVVHGLAAGTDRGAWWFLASLALPAFAAIVLLAIRLDAGRPAPAAPMRQSRAPSVRGDEGESEWEQGSLVGAAAASRPRAPRPLW
ncbi:MAG TPA: hypothetical protein VF712_19830 [Thermoleophilaceae bacterium]|jgi:predicted ferric reductase